MSKALRRNLAAMRATKTTPSFVQTLVSFEEAADEIAHLRASIKALEARCKGKGKVNKAETKQMSDALALLLQGRRLEIERLRASNKALVEAAELMLAYEDRGGDGWWKGWDRLKAAVTAAKEEAC